MYLRKCSFDDFKDLCELGLLIKFQEFGSKNRHLSITLLEEKYLQKFKSQHHNNLCKEYEISDLVVFKF